MNNFKKYGLLLAIIFSVLLHLIIIENFSFKIIQSDKQESFDDMEITIVKPINSLPYKKLIDSSEDIKIVSKKSLIISKQKNNNSSDNQYNNELKDLKDSKKSIDTSKILADISNIEFATKPEKSNNQKRIKSISANTSDYLYRLYFEAWRQKVEKIGAMNYPIEASKLGMFGSLRLTVSLNADGSIKNLFINKSSGYKELDKAALNIVKLGAPYAKFPAEIQKEVDIINITRKWKFTEKNNFSQ